MDGSIVVSAQYAKVHFGKLLRHVEDEGRALVIVKRGRPRALLLSVGDYLRLAVPEPEVLRRIGEESGRKSTNKLTNVQIGRTIKAARRSKNR